MSTSLPDEKVDWILHYLHKNKKDTDIDYNGEKIEDQIQYMYDSNNYFKNRTKLNQDIQENAFGTVTGAASLDTTLKKTVPRILKKDGSFDNFGQFSYNNSVTRGGLHFRREDDYFCKENIDGFDTCYNKASDSAKVLRNRIKFMGDFALSHTFINPNTESNKGHQLAVFYSLDNFFGNMRDLRRRRQEFSRQQRGCVYNKLKEYKFNPNVRKDKNFKKNTAERALKECNIVRTAKRFRDNYNKGPNLEGFYKRINNSDWEPNCSSWDAEDNNWGSNDLWNKA